MAKFEEGKTYTARSVCDANCVIAVTVQKRTARTITTKVRGKSKTLRVSEFGGVECVRPWGSYSMAPIVSAEARP